jgi:hypothetical protein
MSSISISFARKAAQLLRQSVQAPMRPPLKLPGIIGPVIKGNTGLLADIPPINCAGTVLSHPVSHALISKIGKNNSKKPEPTANNNTCVHRLRLNHLLGVHAHEIP